MASRRAVGAGTSLLASVLGAVLLVAGGFSVGLVAGVVSQEPELVVGHLVGRSDEVDWRPDGELLLTEPAVADPGFLDARIEPGRLVGADAPEPSPAAPAEGAPRQALPPVAAPAPAPRSGWAVQVGAFASVEAAQRIRSSLAEKGFAAYLPPSEGDGQHRVRVGPVSSRKDADDLAAQLKSQESLPTWVLRAGS